MAIDVTCQCGSTYSVKEENAGRKFKCKQCGEVLQVPAIKKRDEKLPSDLFSDDTDNYDDSDDELPPPRRGGRSRRRKGRGDAASRVTAPAICLLVLSVVHLLLHLLNALLTLIGVAAVANQGNADGANLAGQVIGVVVGLGIGVLYVWGYWQMLQRRSYSTVRSTVIVSLIPLCSQLVCIGIPFAIWALVVLNDPDVKDSFES